MTLRTIQSLLLAAGIGKRMRPVSATTPKPLVKVGGRALIDHCLDGLAAIGVGNLFGQFLQGALRNPSAADGQFGRLIFGFAVTEALGIFALVIAFLLLFT